MLHWNSYVGQWQELRWSKTGHRLCWFRIWQGRVETSRLDLRFFIRSLALGVGTYHHIIPKLISLSTQRLDNKNLGSLTWDVSRALCCVWRKGFKIFLVSKLRPYIPSVFDHLPTWLYSRWPTPTVNPSLPLYYAPNMKMCFQISNFRCG